MLSSSFERSGKIELHHIWVTFSKLQVKETRMSFNLVKNSEQTTTLTFYDTMCVLVTMYFHQKRVITCLFDPGILWFFLLKRVITLLCIPNINFPQSYSHNRCYTACNTVVVSMAAGNTWTKTVRPRSIVLYKSEVWQSLSRFGTSHVKILSLKKVRYLPKKLLYEFH